MDFFFLFLNQNISCFGYSKNRVNETVLLSTTNMCKKIITILRLNVLIKTYGKLYADDLAIVILFSCSFSGPTRSEVSRIL